MEKLAAARAAIAAASTVPAVATDDVSKMTVSQLKAKLREAGLKLSGNKRELAERLGNGK